MPRSSMRAAISARSAPCTGSYAAKQKASKSAGDQLAPALQQARAAGHRARTRSGPGTSPSFKGPAKWTYFYLYVILDIFSRYVVGWMLADAGERRPGQASDRGDLPPAGYRARTAHVHADRGPSMNSKPVASAAGRPGSEPNRSSAAPRLQRQPLFGGAVQDPEVPARVPGALRLHPGQAGPFAKDSSPGTTTSITIPGSG